MSGVVIDIGTGDGKLVTKLAKEHPDVFVIGIDVDHKSLEKTSAKIYKKPAKGGLENAMFVLADVNDLPEELNGVANQVFINFPWSNLLKGIVTVDQTTWENIKRVCQPGAVVDVVTGYSASHEDKTVKERGLPEFSLGYIQNEMANKLRLLGVDLVEAQELDSEKLKEFPSSWAKRLAYGKERTFFHIRFRIQHNY